MSDATLKKTILETIKVLLIEENREDVEHLKNMLTTAQHAMFKVLFAKNLQQAKKILAYERPEIILTDLFLPEEQGYNAFTELYAIASHFPIVLLTQRDDGNLAIKAIRQGAQDFLVKGKFDANTLIRCIHYAIERKRLLDKLFHVANYDSLTGLPNRHLLLERIGRCLKQVDRRSNYLFALFFMDLDRFKQINDSYGHTIGDNLLIQVAKLLTECARTSDTVARLGGDEFVILLDNIASSQDLIRFAERILFKFKDPIPLDDHAVYAQPSMGITLSSSGYQNSEDMLRDADMAMYRAKERGRGRWEIFDPAIRKDVMQRLQLETDLKTALDKGQLFLQYQPIVSLENGMIVGFEALMRWLHPVYGLIPPVCFIPIAEDCGAILPMGEWAIYIACQQVQTWNARNQSNLTLSMSVNLSVKQFSQMSLIRQIENILKETGLNPENFGIELTETAIFGDAEPIARICRELKTCKVKISLDDFGVGFSSLSHLRLFPIDFLKIDRAFTEKIDQNEMDFKIVESIVSLAHALGIKVIAEGVETQKQLSLLQQMHCDIGQGFLFAKPLNVDDVERLLTQGRPLF